MAQYVALPDRLLPAILPRPRQPVNALGVPVERLPWVGPDVRLVVLAGKQLHRLLERGVLRMRVCGSSWAQVGAALGTTRQSAWRRWRHVDALIGPGDLYVRIDGGRTYIYSRALKEEIPDSRYYGDWPDSSAASLRALVAAADGNGNVVDGQALDVDQVPV